MDNIMERVTLGANFLQQPTWKKAVGIPLIYLPVITTTPFVLILGCSRGQCRHTSTGCGVAVRLRLAGTCRIRQAQKSDLTISFRDGLSGLFLVALYV